MCDLEMKWALRLHLAVMAASIVVGMAQSPAFADSASAWGRDNYGQLGGGNTTNSGVPIAITSLSSGVTAVAGGEYHSLALKNGGVYSWGYNGDGELGNGNLTNVSTPQLVSTLSSGVTAITAGAFDSLAVKNGGVYAWGSNSYGQLGNGSTTDSSTPVAIGSLGSGVTAIAAGTGQSLALKNGAVYAWGNNNNGQLGTGNLTNISTPVAISALSSGVTAVACGSVHSLAVYNGGVYTWGANFYGQLGNGNTISSNTPLAISSLSSGVTAIAGGTLHSIAVQNGGVYTWGYNDYGELGDGTTTSRSTPQRIDPIDLNRIVAVAAGADSNYALSSDGSLWVWGYNFDGELGLGNTTPDYLTPQHLLPPSGFAFTSVDADGRGSHALAMLSAALPSVTVASGQTYHFTANTNTGILTRSLSSLTVNTTGKAVLDPVTNPASRQLLVSVFGLSLSGSTGNWTGFLDVGNNDLDLGYSQLAVVTDQVRQGYAKGQWNGSGGITSTSAGNDPKHLLAIGVMQNNQSGTPAYAASHPFDGTTPGVEDILVKVTFYGDANLDGKVDGSDYSRIDSAYVSHVASGWFNGDFNYDGAVNGSDYTLIDNSFNTQGAALAAEIANINAIIAAVPEPTSVLMLAFCCIALLGRRVPESGPIVQSQRLKR